MLEKLQKQIEAKIDINDIETLNDIANEIESGEWEGAGDWFGHTDDCFDRGIELGRAEAFEEVLNIIKILKDE